MKKYVDKKKELEEKKEFVKYVKDTVKNKEKTNFKTEQKKHIQKKIDDLKGKSRWQIRRQTRHQAKILKKDMKHLVASRIRKPVNYMMPGITTDNKYEFIAITKKSFFLKFYAILLFIIGCYSLYVVSPDFKSLFPFDWNPDEYLFNNFEFYLNDSVYLIVATASFILLIIRFMFFPNKKCELKITLTGRLTFNQKQKSKSIDVLATSTYEIIKRWRTKIDLIVDDKEFKGISANYLDGLHQIMDKLTKK